MFRNPEKILRFLEGIASASEVHPSPYRQREAAGVLLATHIASLDIRDPVVVTIPNGGVPVALPVAEVLGCPLTLCVVGKLPLFSFDQRFGVGAVDATGAYMLNEDLVYGLHMEDAEIISRTQRVVDVLKLQQEALADYLPSRSDMRGKTALLIDDGIASGFTALVAVNSLRGLLPSRIVVATPVGSRNGISHLRDQGIEVTCLLEPDIPALLIENYYQSFPQISREEVQTNLHSLQTGIDRMGIH